MDTGKLIVIEGAGDGIGKSTQYSLLADHMEKCGIKVTKHHFPSYGTVQGAPVEEYLSGNFGKVTDLSPYVVNNLYAVDRMITWHTDLSRAYERGDTVLLDRYTTSSLIYQSASIPEPDEKIRFINYVTDFEYDKLGIKAPDAVIYLNAPYDVICALRAARKVNEGIESDIHESNEKYMKMVYESAGFVADFLGWTKIECASGGKMRPIEDIQSDIIGALRAGGINI